MNSDFGETSAPCCLEGDSGLCRAPPAADHTVGPRLRDECLLLQNKERTVARAPSARGCCVLKGVLSRQVCLAAGARLRQTSLQRGLHVALKTLFL